MDFNKIHSTLSELNRETLKKPDLAQKGNPLYVFLLKYINWQFVSTSAADITHVYHGVSEGVRVVARALVYLNARVQR